jgi:hypothetical protein
MQRDACDVAPVSTLHVRVEQAQIRDEVLLVVPAIALHLFGAVLHLSLR